MAVQDVEVVVHAGGQQQVGVGGVPLQTPHAPTHRRLAEGLTHTPAVPQQHLLIVAEEEEEGEEEEEEEEKVEEEEEEVEG